MKSSVSAHRLLSAIGIWAGVVMAQPSLGQELSFEVKDPATITPLPILDEVFVSDFDPDQEQELDEWLETDFIAPYACKGASSSQVAVIDKGNAKYQRFMQSCLSATNHFKWCQQLTRPNPSSRSTFTCTYGARQPHRLIHPDEATWKNAFQAVKLIQQLEAQGIAVKLIYNWWRPEPYNSNVGGAAERHPFGTSVDVRFTSLANMERAHKQLCKWRAQGKLRALGYYGSTGLHFGIGDRNANTWGKDCR